MWRSCRFATKGCNLSVHEECTSWHEDACHFRTKPCPLAAMSFPCSWEGSITEVPDHVREIHAAVEASVEEIKSSGVACQERSLCCFRVIPVPSLPVFLIVQFIARCSEQSESRATPSPVLCPSTTRRLEDSEQAAKSRPKARRRTKKPKKKAHPKKPVTRDEKGEQQKGEQLEGKVVPAVAELTTESRSEESKATLSESKTLKIEPQQFTAKVERDGLWSLASLFAECRLQVHQISMRVWTTHPTCRVHFSALLRETGPFHSVDLDSVDLESDSRGVHVEGFAQPLSQGTVAEHLFSTHNPLSASIEFDPSSYSAKV